MISPIRVAAAGALLSGLILFVAGVGAHAFVIRSEPGSGATLAEAPAQVRIWFDGPVEPMFIDVRVEDGRKQRVDKGGGRLHLKDNTLVEAQLAPLAAGRYRVFWSVVARDGHRREGEFSFLVK